MFKLNIKERLKNVGKRNVEYAGKIVGVTHIKETTNWIIEMGKVAFIPKKSERAETFNQAQARLGVTNEDIAKVYKNYSISFYISVLCAFFCIGGAIHYYTEGTFIGVVSMLSIMSVCLANSFRFSFRAYQIKHRTLCSPNEWYANKKEWLPTI